MRADMHKVIVERPRYGSHRPNSRTGLRLARDRIAHALYEGADHDGGPLRPQAARRDKEFNEHLGPLRRFLRRQVGRPWDKIHSEIRERIDTRSALGLHVMQHLYQFVETRTFLEGREVYTYGCWHRPVPVRGLYVHPVSGLLRWKERNRSQTGSIRSIRN
jgi:hypothetical protein